MCHAKGVLPLLTRDMDVQLAYIIMWLDGVDECSGMALAGMRPYSMDSGDNESGF